MAIKDLLQKTADKYKVAITYGENSAEITGNPHGDRGGT